MFNAEARNPVYNREPKFDIEKSPSDEEMANIINENQNSNWTPYETLKYEHEWLCHDDVEKVFNDQTHHYLKIRGSIEGSLALMADNDEPCTWKDVQETKKSLWIAFHSVVYWLATIKRARAEFIRRTSKLIL